ncbi:MAG: type II toxin-antitoxin system death-on-curing family toxin [Clostridia bacterium]|nr:type II toxin-antitoxin system death-on-curing family toxin [Clostridia bacterium]
MIRFDIQKATMLQELIIGRSGGTQGIRDMGLLDAALSSAYQTFGGTEFYLTIEEKAAKIGSNLIANHAFIDGNKRIGLLIMLTFLEVNDVDIECTDQELVDIGLSLASGSMKYEELLEWIQKHKQI